MTYNHDETLSAALKALQNGNLEQALKFANVAIEHRPDDAECWSVYGLAKGGDEGLKALQKAVEMEPGEPRWYLHLGNRFSDEDRYRAAEKAYAKAGELSHGHPEAMTAWANALMKLLRFAEAAQIYKHVLQIKPSADLWIKAGDALVGARDTISAAFAYEQAHNKGVRPPAMSAKLADLHIMLNQYDQAEGFNNEVLAKDSTNAAAGLRAANLKRWKGKHEEAILIQKEFLKVNPNDLNLIAALLDDKVDEVAENAKALLEKEDLELNGRRRLAFALARFFDRIKEETAAWQYAMLANSLYEDGQVYDDGKKHRMQLSNALDLYKSMPDGSPHDGKMIYVIGPPRCGGSLLQMILARVPGVVSVGERGALLEWLLPGLDNRDSLISNVIHLGEADIAGMVRATGPADVFVDKTSSHILVAGLLSKFHPGAKFVLPTRNKADMAVSMLFHDFTPEFAYTRTVQGIMAYLKFQDEAAEAWQRAGIDMLSHDHDAFVGKPDVHGKNLFEVLGLSWKSEYTSSASSDAVVRTFSARQVTEGVSSKYSGRGERYAEFLSSAGFDSST